jgi:hypothetical protein
MASVTVGGRGRDITKEEVIRMIRGIKPEPIREHLVEIAGTAYPPKQVLETRRSVLSGDCPNSKRPLPSHRGDRETDEPRDHAGSGSRQLALGLSDKPGDACDTTRFGNGGDPGCDSGVGDSARAIRRVFGLLGLLCRSERRKYVTNLSLRAMSTAALLIHGPTPQRRQASRGPWTAHLTRKLTLCFARGSEP